MTRCKRCNGVARRVSRSERFTHLGHSLALRYSLPESQTGTEPEALQPPVSNRRLFSPPNWRRVSTQAWLSPVSAPINTSLVLNLSAVSNPA